MPRVHAEPHGDLDGLIKLGKRGTLHELDRLLRLVARVGVDLLGRGEVLLPVVAHQASTSAPIDRAAPATIAIAASIVSQFRSGSFTSAIFRTCAFVSFPTLFRFG